MMHFMPSSTNTNYKGHISTVWFTYLLAILTIIPGLIHLYLPDGGASVIAGLDLQSNAALIIALFAWAGTTQFIWGLMILSVAHLYRHLIPLTLALILLHYILSALNMWVLKPVHTESTPESFIILGLIPLIAIMLAIAVITSKKA